MTGTAAVTHGQTLDICVNQGGAAGGPSGGGAGGGASGVSAGSTFASPLVVAGGGGGGAGGTVTPGSGGNAGASGGGGSSSTASGPGPGNSGSGYGGGGGGGYVGGGGGSGGPVSATGGSGGTNFCNITGCTTASSNGTAKVVLTYTVASAPTTAIATPANGATYPLGGSAASNFTCTEGANGPGISSCADQNSRGSGAALDTSSVGQHTFTVTATSSDGLSSTQTVTYNVAAPPVIWLPLPQDGAVYTQGQSVNSYFLCGDGQGGPGLTSCVDQSGHTSGATIDTSTLGSHTYTVTATSGDGLVASAKATYTVVAQPTVTGITSRHGIVTFTITLTAPGAVDAMVTTSFNSFAVPAAAHIRRHVHADADTLQPAQGTIVYARADVVATGPGTLNVTLKQTQAAKVLLRDHRSAPVALVVAYTGAAGLPQTVATQALSVTR